MSILVRPRNASKMVQSAIDAYSCVHPDQSMDNIKRDFILLDWQTFFHFQFFQWTKYNNDRKVRHRRQRRQLWRRLNKSITRCGEAFLLAGQKSIIANSAIRNMNQKDTTQ